MNLHSLKKSRGREDRIKIFKLLMGCNIEDIRKILVVGIRAGQGI